ncbi:MAG TPA: hypothetical protein VFU31_17305 [Candidatus Binatia bacterium]|nr:hypothetical protein [Candidatus Binatia bacterium]
MYIKGLVFGIVMLGFLLPAGSSAQTRSARESIQPKDVSMAPLGSIVLISKEESDSPGYVHAKYAFVDAACAVPIVDHYGPPVNPDDKNLKQSEQRMCRELALDTRDSE